MQGNKGIEIEINILLDRWINIRKKIKRNKKIYIYKDKGNDKSIDKYIINYLNKYIQNYI